MTSLVVIVFALLGYWIVTWILDYISGQKPSKTNQFESQTGQSSNDKKYSNTAKQEGMANNWFLTLDVSASATKNEISSAFKHKIRQYHPDKVASLGPELRELAESKSKEINAAYEYAMKLHT